MSDRTEDVVTLADLAACGLSREDIRRRAPWAVEHVGLHGEVCWLREDFEQLLQDGEGHA